MNAAERATSHFIARALQESPAYQRVDDSLFVIKQGSTFVMIAIGAWGKDRALVRVSAQLVKGGRMDGTLALKLLELNGALRFGAFHYDEIENIVFFSHTLLGGKNLNEEELRAAVSEVALIADEYDDKLQRGYGGQRMRDLLAEEALQHALRPSGMLVR